MTFFAFKVFYQLQWGVETFQWGLRHFHSGGVKVRPLEPKIAMTSGGAVLGFAVGGLNLPPANITVGVIIVNILCFIKFIKFLFNSYSS